MSTKLGRGRTAVVAGALVASSLVMVTQGPASAVGISDPPTLPHSIIVFPQRDFVSASGYAPGDRATVEVVRGGFVVGTASNLVPTDDPKTPAFEGLVEVNHPGGGCWEGVTPDIRPDDVVRVLTAPGTGDSTPTAGVTVTQPATKTSDTTVVMKGTAVAATGGQIPVAQIEARIVANQQLFVVNGRRTLRASSAGGDGILTYDGPGQTTWTATFTGLGGVSTVDGVSDADRAVVSQSRGLWLGRAPGTTAEGTIYEYGEVGGPAAPCTAPLASGPSVPDMTAATDTGASSSDNVTSNQTPTFAGVVGLTSATSVTLYVDGAANGTATVGAGGTYSLTPATALTPGAHQVTASETTPGSPETMSTGSLSITVDTAAPGAPVVTGTTPASPSGSTAPSVKGTAETGSTVTVHTGPSCPAPAAGSGSAASFTSTGIGVTVAAGSTTDFFATATDVAGNVSACSTSSVSYTQDGVAPPAPVIAASSTSGLVKSTSASFSFSDTETTATFECSRDGAAFSTCTSPKDYTALTQGSHTFSVRALDQAGNTSAASSTSWTVDTVAPTVTITSAPASLSNNNSPVFGFSTNEPAATSCSLVLTSAVDNFTGCTSPQAYSGLADGRYRFAVMAVDPAGNSRVVTRVFTIDTKAPVVTITGKPTVSTADSTPTFTFTTELSATTRCSLELSGAPVNLVACTSPTTYGPLADGTYKFAVNGTDAAGNTSTPVTYTFTVDTGAPTVSPQAPAANAKAVSQTANITALLSEKVTGIDSTSFTLSSGGTTVPAVTSFSALTRVATLNPDASLAPDTTYTVTMTGAVKDSAGNALSPTSWSFVTGPAPTAVTGPANNATGIDQTRNVTATFSEAVLGVSGTSFKLVDADGIAVGAVVSYDPAARIATLNPTASLAADTVYTATLTSSIHDIAGNPLTTKVWKFTTGPRPTLTSTTPAANATGVSRVANVTATFSEDVHGVSSTTFVLKDTLTGTQALATVSYNLTTRVATLNPSATLAANTKYTATIGAGVTDVAGNPFLARSWSFTTGP